MEYATCFRCHVFGSPLFVSGPFGIMKCPICGQAFTSPRLDASERATYYENYESPLLPIWSKILAGPRIDAIAQFTAGRKLLDVGCGAGEFLAEALRKGWNACGTDVSSKEVAKGRAKGLPEYVLAIEAGTLAPGQFDVVTFWEVLEHVDDPIQTLSATRAVLADGGLVAFSVPDFGSLPSKLLGSLWWTLMPAQHLWHFENATLRRLLSETGFSVVRLDGPSFGITVQSPDHMAGIAVKK